MRAAGKLGLLAPVIAVLSASAPAGAQPGNTPAASADAPSLKADSVARKHVRGCPVDRDCSDPLQADLIEFEVQAFGSPDSPWVASDNDAVGTARRRNRKPTEIRPDLPWLAELNMPGFPVRWDERIIKYLEFYKDDPRGRNIMSAWLRDQGKYRDMILHHLRRAGLPADLIYVCMIESSYDSLEYSRAGASGLWQFMPKGGRVYGLEINGWVDERNDPLLATRAVLSYWQDLHQRFKNWDLAMAAFNAGYAGVLRSIAKYNTNDFWELLEYENGLPWGSRIYVPKALAAAIVGHNRKLFGYDTVKDADPVVWDDVTVPRSLSLKTVARAAGTTEDAIKRLNPHLRRNRTPPRMRNYTVHIPRGRAGVFRERLLRMRSEWDRYDEYRLRHGERFEDVATMHGISRRALARLNGVSHESEVQGGEWIVVPRVSRETKLRNHARAMDKLYAGGHPKGDPGDKLIVALKGADLRVKGRKPVYYRVVSGDSQYRVARAFGVERQQLAAWNGLDPEGLLFARMVLRVFVDDRFDARKKGIKLLDPRRLIVVERGSERHMALSEGRLGRERITLTVKRKQSLAEIGKPYGLSDWDVSRINRLPRNTVLEPGDKVVVYKVVAPKRSKRAARQARRARAHAAKTTKRSANKSSKKSKRKKTSAKKKTPAKKKKTSAKKGASSAKKRPKS